MKFGCKKIIRSVDMVETVTSDQMSPHCDPEFEQLKTANQSLCMTFDPCCYITIPSLVTDGSAAEDIIQKNIQWNLKPFL